MIRNILNAVLIIAAVVISGFSANAQNRKDLPTCAGSQLSLKAAGGDADMGGKRYGNYVFTNVSSKPCRMSGYPRFVLLDRAGKTMRGVKVTYDWNINGEERSKSSSVTLKPGQTAWFQVFYNDGMPFDLKKPVPSSSKVKITPPHATRDFVIKSQINAYKNLQVSAVRGGLPQ